MIKSNLKKFTDSETLYCNTDSRNYTNYFELILFVFSPSRIRFLVVLFLLSVCSCVLSACLMFSEIRAAYSNFSSFHFIDVFGSITPLTPFFIVSLLMAIVNIINIICLLMSYKSFTGQKDGKLVSANRSLRIASVVGIGAEVISMITFFGFFGIIYGYDYVPDPFFKALPPIIFSCMPLIMMIGQHICIIRIFAKCEKNNLLPSKKSTMSFLVFSLLYCLFVILFPLGFIDLFMLQFYKMILGIVLLWIYALPVAYAVKIARQYLKILSSHVMNT